MTHPRCARPLAKALGLTLAWAAASWPGVGAAQEPAPEGWPSSSRIRPLAEQVAASGDNEGLPFAIIDKETAQLAVYDAGGDLKGMAPVLIGSAVGDGSAPDVGDRALSDIPPEDRTTPAGRFYGGYGPAADGSTVLWVDYQTAISLHPVVDTNRAERRPERLLSPTAEDNRITFGCINVAGGFYADVVSTTFAAGGVFYVLPEATPMDVVFAGLGNRQDMSSRLSGPAGF